MSVQTMVVFVMDSAEDTDRHEAPVVVLRGQSDPVGELASSDKPSLSTTVPYGQLSVEVRCSFAADEVDPVEYVVLSLDGRPVDDNRYLVDARARVHDGQRHLTYRYSLPCPSPGKHLLQARYKRDNLWSRLSAPLRFEIRLPEPPRVVAISDSDRNPVPLSQGGLISIAGPSVKLRLADVSRDSQVVVYLDGKPITSGRAAESCCLTVTLEGSITPGLHSLTVRTIHPPGSCSITSEPSNEVVFHYYDEDVFLLRAVDSPPSPFCFASPAHFPLREFGARGEVIDRQGAVIYEDMVFSFDRQGNYNLRFSIRVPALPTTLHLQFLLQPCEGGPWYTITLPPMEFRPEEGTDGQAKPRLIRDYVVEGRSEILSRCYPEMGKKATIRRTGSARFGFGAAAM
ncbi:MAG: hypothetical protein ACYTG0_26150 [Planctomycetota bacterium]|jgi:hypothetical protein